MCIFKLRICFLYFQSEIVEMVVPFLPIYTDWVLFSKKSSIIARIAHVCAHKTLGLRALYHLKRDKLPKR